MSDIADNLKVLIWQSKPDRNMSYPEYIDLISQQCRMLPGRFRDILRDKVSANAQEESALQRYFEKLGFDTYAIRYGFLYADIIEESKEELLDKNIQYLLNSLKHGQNKAFTDAIGVNASTVTRWKKGITRPDRYALTQIARYYGFPDVNFMKTSFLFLDLDPVSVQQKKDECKSLIDAMDKEAFEALYPAIRKLLG